MTFFFQNETLIFSLSLLKHSKSTVLRRVRGCVRACARARVRGCVRACTVAGALACVCACMVSCARAWWRARLRACVRVYVLPACARPSNSQNYTETQRGAHYDIFICTAHSLQFPPYDTILTFYCTLTAVPTVPNVKIIQKRSAACTTTFLVCNARSISLSRHNIGFLDPARIR